MMAGAYLDNHRIRPCEDHEGEREGEGGNEGKIERRERDDWHWREVQRKAVSSGSGFPKPLSISRPYHSVQLGCPPLDVFAFLHMLTVCLSLLNLVGVGFVFLQSAFSLGEDTVIDMLRRTSFACWCFIRGKDGACWPMAVGVSLRGGMGS